MLRGEHAEGGLAEGLVLMLRGEHAEGGLAGVLASRLLPAP
jgi:hypothetical protein